MWVSNSKREGREGKWKEKNRRKGWEKIPRGYGIELYCDLYSDVTVMREQQQQQQDGEWHTLRHALGDTRCWWLLRWVNYTTVTYGERTQRYIDTDRQTHRQTDTDNVTCSASAASCAPVKQFATSSPAKTSLRWHSTIPVQHVTSSQHCWHHRPI